MAITTGVKLYMLLNMPMRVILLSSSSTMIEFIHFLLVWYIIRKNKD